MTNETLYERIKRLSNVPIKQLEKELGLKDGLIQKWKQSKPRIDNFLLVAQRLGVSMEYLWRGEKTNYQDQTDLAKRTTTPISTELAELSNDKDFVNSAKLYKAVDNEYKKQICAYILGVATALGVNIAQILGK